MRMQVTPHAIEELYCCPDQPLIVDLCGDEIRLSKKQIRTFVLSKSDSATRTDNCLIESLQPNLE